MIGCAAEMYGNQDEIGRALDKLFSEGVVKRQDLWVTSKARPLTLADVCRLIACQSRKRKHQRSKMLSSALRYCC